VSNGIVEDEYTVSILRNLTLSINHILHGSRMGREKCGTLDSFV
jgi:hypothetical protein